MNEGELKEFEAARYERLERSAMDELRMREKLRESARGPLNRAERRAQAAKDRKR